MIHACEIPGDTKKILAGGVLVHRNAVLYGCIASYSSRALAKEDWKNIKFERGYHNLLASGTASVKENATAILWG